MSATQPSRRHEELERHSSNALERISSNAPELDAFAAAVAAHLAAAMPAPAPARDPEALLEARAAAELLAVPPSWLRAEARAGRVPHRRFGKYVRFDRVELLEWADRQARGPRTGTSRRLSATCTTRRRSTMPPGSSVRSRSPIPGVPIRVPTRAPCLCPRAPERTQEHRRHGA